MVTNGALRRVSGKNSGADFVCLWCCLMVVVILWRMPAPKEHREAIL